MIKNEVYMTDYLSAPGTVVTGFFARNFERAVLLEARNPVATATGSDTLRRA